MIDLEFVGDYRNPQQLTARQRELGFDGTSAGEFTFDDFIDIINPLQHIPVISTLYRAITGDEISPHARIFGDTLFGGPSGFLSAAATTLFEEVAGEDIGETVLAFFTGETTDDAPQFAGSAAPDSAAAALAAGRPAAGLAIPGESTAKAEDKEAPRAAATGSLPAMEGPGLLTGQNALDALFADLTRGRAKPRPLPTADPQEAIPLPARTAGTEVKSYPLPPRGSGGVPAAAVDSAASHPAASSDAATEAAVAHPLIFAQNAGEADIADRMMQALDKYAAMSRQRREDRNKPEEETRWRSDPVLRGDDS